MSYREMEKEAMAANEKTDKIIYKIGRNKIVDRILAAMIVTTIAVWATLMIPTLH
ncbi:MAG: hypothetical protein VB031_02410 [Eubacteriaceae bacterium]|nr:hypothetical protein [Eubacteriaceae bacterium]